MTGSAGAPPRRAGVTTSFLYDGWDVVQEKQGATVSADLLLGLGVDERLSRMGSTVLTDALGSAVGLSTAGAVQTRYGYDPYGVATATGTASDNPFQFTGRENDGTGLLAYRNRYYNPAWGRFVSEDPIGLRGGVNAYRYAANNPVQFSDPSGLIPNGLGPSTIKAAEGDGGIKDAASADDPQGIKQFDAAVKAAGLGSVDKGDSQIS